MKVKDTRLLEEPRRRVSAASVQHSLLNTSLNIKQYKKKPRLAYGSWV